MDSTPDFVITRKRKRYAVDPCLGFYGSQPQSRPLVNDIRISAPGQIIDPDVSVGGLYATAPDIPSGLALIPGTSATPATPDFEAPMMTVEDFLQRSAHKRIRKYGRRRQHFVRLDNDSIPRVLREDKRRSRTSLQPCSHNSRHDSSRSQSLSSSPYCPSSMNDDSSPEDQNQGRCYVRKRRVKSLAGRLIQAAILSHANPVDSLLHSKQPLSSRPPLQFVPHDMFPCFTERRIQTLVDPRKAAPFHSASFLSHNGQASYTSIQRGPLSKWRTHCNLLAQEPASKSLKKPVAPTSIPSRRPLMFVPLHQAGHVSKPRLRCVSSPLEFGRAARNPLIITHSTTTVPLSLVPLIPEGRLKTPKRADLLSLTSEPALIPLPRSTFDRTNTSEPPKSPYMFSNNGQIASAVETTPESDMPGAESTDLSSLLAPQYCPPSQDPKKQLKPLASFLDNFLKTARTATELQARTTSRNATSEGIMPQSTFGGYGASYTQISRHVTPKIHKTFPIHTPKPPIRTAIRTMQASSPLSYPPTSMHPFPKRRTRRLLEAEVYET